ncbi:hypothetical protein [Arthrobacter sp. SO3]|uniref:hypothetical protein n=1 Tax=Arthrobacter sp. SO3 TaxID=1897057 RepID=UPI001CFFF3B0|nr:hypothetical protein [Arthrobacter sp. SO3]
MGLTVPHPFARGLGSIDAEAERAAAAVVRGPLPEAGRQRREDAVAEHAGEWAGEV